MYISIFIPQILREMWCHRLRSSLAIFCIAFGTFMMMMLIALNAGFYKRTVNDMLDIVDGSFFIWRGTTIKSYQGYPKGSTNNIMIADVIELPKIFPSVARVSVRVQRTASISYAGKAYSKTVFGISPESARLDKVKLVSGSRFFNQFDLKQNARVAVISDKTKKILFGNREALGDKILINNVPFVVVGVILEEGAVKHGIPEDVLISYQSYTSLFGDEPIWVFQAVAKFGTDSVQFEQMLRGHFARKLHFDKNDKEAIGFWGARKVFTAINLFLFGVWIFLSGCGLMVLAVGSVGVANIMFLIVTERTYEIGLRKALGANSRQIFLPLLFEVLIIVILGGFLGMMSAFSVTFFLQQITLPDWLGVPTLSWLSSFATTFILALVGLITGFFPARRAAKMDPVTALMG